MMCLIMKNRNKKYCMDCGKSHETGSQIFFECPRNGNWMSATDRCRFDETE